MEIWTANVGICGPLFIAGYAQPFTLRGSRMIDGFIIYPDQNIMPEHIYVDSKENSNDQDQMLKDLFILYAKDKAANWIDKNKGSLSEYLTSTLKFNKATLTEITFLTYKGRFDKLSDLVTGSFSNELKHLIDQVTKYPKFDLR